MISFESEIRTRNRAVLDPFSSLLESWGDYWSPRMRLKVCSPSLNLVQPARLCSCPVTEFPAGSDPHHPERGDSMFKHEASEL